MAVKPGWVEYPNLYFAIVAQSGLGKSPSTRAVMAPLKKTDQEWFREYETQKSAYDEEIKSRKNLSKEERASLGADPDPPIRRRILMNDTTPEALLRAFQHNPRGLLWFRDELGGLILNLDRFANQKGGTKSLLMEGYDSEGVNIDRVNDSACIPHVCLSLFGTIQPEFIPHVFSDLDASMGFLPRFILITADRKKPALWIDRGILSLLMRCWPN
jgi:hypothetical protein